MRRTRRFDTITLQTYTDTEIALIAAVEHQYPDLVSIGDVVADYLAPIWETETDRAGIDRRITEVLQIVEDIERETSRLSHV